MSDWCWQMFCRRASHYETITSALRSAMKITSDWCVNINTKRHKSLMHILILRSCSGSSGLCKISNNPKKIQLNVVCNPRIFQSTILFTKPIASASVPSDYVSLNYKKHCTLRYLVFRIHIGDPRLNCT